MPGNEAVLWYMQALVSLLRGKLNANTIHSILLLLHNCHNRNIVYLEKKRSVIYSTCCSFVTVNKYM